MSTIRYRPKRPKSEPAAQLPASDDICVIDGATNGVRALPMSYFSSRYAPKTTSGVTYVAGSNITLVDTPTATVIYRSYPNQGIDDIENYTAGTTTSLVYGYGFTAGRAVSIQDPQGLDDFETYSVGAISYLLYGSGTNPGWASDGRIVSIQDVGGLDDFEAYGTGSISSLTQGSGWASSGRAVTI